jgi:O-antigen ligase
MSRRSDIRILCCTSFKFQDDLLAKLSRFLQETHIDNHLNNRFLVVTSSEKLKTAIAVVYSILAFAASIPYGLVSPIPLAIVAICMFMLSIASYFVFGKPKRGMWVFRTVLFITIILAIWIYLQSIPLPIQLYLNPIWKNVHQLGGVAAGSISLEPADTLASLVVMGLPAITFMTGLIIADTDKRARLMISFAAMIAGFIAVFGLFQFLLFPGILIGTEKIFYLDSLTAVFVNRNTAATFLGLGLMILLTTASDTGLNIFDYRQDRSIEIAEKVRFSLFVALAAACLTGLLLTQSRAGIFSTVLALAIYLPFLIRQWVRRVPNLSLLLKNRDWTRLVVTAGVFLSIGALGFALAGRVILRADIRGSEDARFCFWPDVMRGVSENWLLGTGFGTFGSVFSSFRTAACGIHGVIDRAHNSYLEAFFTLGVAGPLIIAFLLMVLVRSFWQGFRSRRRLRHYAVLGFCGTLLTAFHAVTDFSLQIPGYAIFFSAFLAGTISICCGREGIEQQGERSDISPSRGTPRVKTA